METEYSEGKSLIIASNRLPITINCDENGEKRIEQGSGGLVTAMAPVLRNRGGTWIGWTGDVDTDNLEINRLLQSQSSELGYVLKSVHLSSKERDMYYRGFANEVIWPLFHDFVSTCVFDPEYWEHYDSVNEKFAKVIAANANSDSFIWIHDYHLMRAATKLRDLGVRNKIGYFLHIPFPPPDIFVRLPWRFQIINSLLDYDLIGFQTNRDKQNFIRCVRMYVKNIRIKGRGQIAEGHIGDRRLRIGAFPISIDYNEFARMAASEEVSRKAWYIHEDYPKKQIILGVDRLDYTKGIPERLQAFRNALIRYPELRGEITLMQIVVPSRKQIPSYSDLKAEIEILVSNINGEFTESGWIPIVYIYQSFPRDELTAYYRTSEIALITPLKDGMNLVAKEYCACNIEQTGALILSEFTGASAQLYKGAIMVNPHDVVGIADAIHQVYHMSKEERVSRMKVLRRNVRNYDIFRWVDSFMEVVIAKRLDHFPVIKDFNPVDNLTT